MSAQQQPNDKPQQSETIFDHARRDERERDKAEAERRRQFDEMMRRQGETYR
jgi:hypothetical protein